MAKGKDKPTKQTKKPKSDKPWLTRITLRAIDGLLKMSRRAGEGTAYSFLGYLSSVTELPRNGFMLEGRLTKRKPCGQEKPKRRVSRVVNIRRKI